MLRRFEGKSSLVTGSSSGMGRATALRLAEEGARVLAVDRNAEGLERLAAESPATGQIVPHTADVSDEDQVRTTVRAALGHFGGLDVLVNNAGILHMAPLPEQTVADFHRVLQVNLLGTFLFCREAMPALVRRRGVVVNVASAAATHAHPFMTAYAASKGGILAFSISLAHEYTRQGVRVVVVSPGGVDTPLMRSVQFPDHVDPSFYQRITPPLGFGTPEQLAGTIAYVASGDAGFLTGVEIRVDGGSGN
ncbi:oxidoreductase [Longimycelium tulufanense]|uniref:Oxidoreductase n=1 Tax=Longimycelium tulufanense TaxID=907463 RepID=A0A8J3FT88_9PSEU|nr:SDR family oxidoreductase [Longimycelium tulufanense]GGM43878.1 oxidoreductase [Longimycelium tulufanense]